MEPVWIVRSLANDNYEFEFIPVGVGAGEVEILHDIDGEVVIPAGQPFAMRNTFVHQLAPGRHVIGWHWMQGRPEIRAYCAFEVPLGGTAVTLNLPSTDREALGLAAVANRYQVVRDISVNTDTYERANRRISVMYDSSDQVVSVQLEGSDVAYPSTAESAAALLLNEKA